MPDPTPNDRHPGHRHIHVPMLGRAAPPFGSDFVSLEAASGIVLLAATVAALVWANTATASYLSWWGHELTLGRGDFAITQTLGHWVNTGLMTLFFFVVGLEIKRELVTGELRDRSRAALPAVAAVGGMIVPALVYVAVNVGSGGAKGWAIPVATDIAFAVGVLAILGARVPSGLKLFLLTLAIVDDIGAIVVIALFFSRGVSPGWLLAGGLTVVVVVVMSRLGVNHPLAYVIPAVVLWICLHEGGVEPTLAGVVLGLLTPARPRDGVAVLERLENGLHPFSSFVVVPLFALANAGVVLTAETISYAVSSRVTIGIIAGLVIGKFVGILGASTLALRVGIGRLPAGMDARHLVGVAALGGIGFTVSLFIADLTFRGTSFEDAKLGVFAASTLAAVIGITLLAVLLHPTPEERA